LLLEEEFEHNYKPERDLVEYIKDKMSKSSWGKFTVPNTNNSFTFNTTKSPS